MVARIAFHADSQVDERHRLAEHERVMEFISRDSEERGCNLTLCGGDVYERRSTETERRAVAEWVEAAARLGDVVICGGNHEAAGEVEEIGRCALNGVGAVLATESPIIHALDACLVAVLPWPRRERLRAWLERQGRTSSIDDANTLTSEMLRDILRGFAVEFDRLDPAGTLPRVLLGHVAVSGYRVDVDQPAVAGGLTVSVEDLMLACADVVLLGHIHLPQSWVGVRADGVSVPVIYSGSPRRTAYASGELVEKGYVVVEFDGRAPKWQRVRTPATPMILVEAAFSGVALECSPVGEVDQAEIRLRYTVPSDQRDAARALADAMATTWYDRGAIEVRVEPVILPTTRARAPEVAAAVGVEPQLRVMWSAAEMEPQRIETLAGLARVVEEAVR